MEKFPGDPEDISKLNSAFYILKESLMSGRLFESEVASNSMFPFLNIGDKVTIGNVIPEKLKSGDIVVYKRNSSLYAHRYIYTLKRQGGPISLVTKADNRFDFDSYLVSIEQLVGKVIVIKGKGTKINLENFLWEKINSLIGIISSVQAFIFKVLRYFKPMLLGKKTFPFFKQIIAFPFSILIKSIILLAYLNKKTGLRFF